jgi:hypothetical protein
MSPKKTCKQQGGMFGLDNLNKLFGKETPATKADEVPSTTPLTTGGKKKSKHSKTSKKISKKMHGLKKMKRSVSKKMFKFF